MAPAPKASQVAVTGPSLPVGSNGIAVAPSKSADGATRLLVNSHQPYVGPVAWYEAVLRFRRRLARRRRFLPRLALHATRPQRPPGLGQHRQRPQSVDRLSAGRESRRTPDQYQLDGKWKNFEKGDAAIRVKIFGPLIWTVHRPLLWSVQGPVLKTDHGVFAVRYAGMGEARQPLQYYRLNKAANRDEWLAAMRLQALPSINYIYADEKGNIGYVYNGQFPVRAEGRDWTQVQPGDRSDLIWHGYLPFERVPQIWNPKSGYVFNSNNTPFQATGAAGRAEDGRLQSHHGHPDRHDQQGLSRPGNFRRRCSHHRRSVPRLQVRHRLQRPLRLGPGDRRGAQGRSWF